MVDQFTPGLRYFVVACKSANRYFDLDAVREPSRNPLGVGVRPTMARVNGADENDARSTLGPFTEEMQAAGAPPLDWWQVSDESISQEGETVGMATWYTGDALKVLRTLSDSSVDLVMTSPPFLALRSYLPQDHPDKGLEIGSEGTPGAFLDVLLDVTEELARVLAPHGSLVMELGDTYSGGLGFDGTDDFAIEKGRGKMVMAGTGPVRNRKGDGWPLAKSLCLIPSSFAWALAYGRNPWTGRTTPPWRVRNLIAWCRPNPPVGALGDKFRPGTSYLTVAAKNANRYFDLDAVREPYKYPDQVRAPLSQFNNGPPEQNRRHDMGEFRAADGAGAPPLDWWEIPTHPYPGSHYATFPPQLCVRPIKSMCPQRVCRVCGRPSERITAPTEEYAAERQRMYEGGDVQARKDRKGLSGGRTGLSRISNGVVSSAPETLGWSDCGHNDYRNGVVLDPFAGSGTTLEVATGHGRDAIGIDLDPRNLDLARQRIGMFLSEAVDISPPETVG